MTADILILDSTDKIRSAFAAHLRQVARRAEERLRSHDLHLNIRVEIQTVRALETSHAVTFAISYREHDEHEPEGRFSVTLTRPQLAVAFKDMAAPKTLPAAIVRHRELSRQVLAVSETGVFQ